MKLVLVRYGEYTDGHLNEQGRRTMTLVSGRLKSVVQNAKVCIICANIPRAIESAEIITKEFNAEPAQSFTELYAAEENGVGINLDTALKIIDTAGQGKDVVVAIISREYIQAISKHFGGPDAILKRGEI